MTALATNAVPPPDIETMRAEAERLLVRGVELPSGDEALDSLRLELRGHIQVLVPEVEKLGASLPRDDIRRREAALTCAGEGRMRLRLGRGDTLDVRVSVVQRLARTVSALCSYYELLTGAERCADCDKPIEHADEPVPYDHVRPSGGARVTRRLHVHCVGTALSRPRR
jgi:hypothetical protein